MLTIFHYNNFYKKVSDNFYYFFKFELQPNIYLIYHYNVTIFFNNKRQRDFIMLLQRRFFFYLIIIIFFMFEELIYI